MQDQLLHIFTLVTVLAEKYSEINEIRINEEDHYASLITITKQDEDIISLFIKDPDNNIRIISGYSEQMRAINKDSF